MNKYIFILFILSLLTSGCKPNKKIENNKSYSFIEKKEKHFFLDETTVENASYIQFIEQDSNKLLAFINEYDNSIIINDYSTGKLLKKIHFEKDGSKGIGTLWAFCLTDSLIYLYNHQTSTLYTTDMDANIKSKETIDLYSQNPHNHNLPTLIPRSLSPITKIDDTLILCGFNSAEPQNENSENMPATVLYNLKNKKITFTNSYPQVYHKGNWLGGFTYRNICYTTNLDNNLIISYSADKNIYTNDLKGNIKHFYAGISNDDLKPISENRNEFIPFEQEIDHYMSNITYGGVFHDKKERLYYRIALLPTDHVHSTDNLYNKKMQLVIFDESFNFIGIYDLPKDTYRTSVCFMSEEGLHIQAISNNDDIMKFRVFKIQKK